MIHSFDVKKYTKQFILPVYKNKILLSSNENLLNKNSQNFWKLLDKSIFEKFGIKKNEIVQISSSLYYIKMTDKNVNELTRNEGLLLGFYSYNELYSLTFTNESIAILDAHKEMIRKILDKE